MVLYIFLTELKIIKMIDSKSIEENNIATTQNSYQPPTISYTQYTQPIKQENFQPVTLSNTTEQAQITNPSKKQMYIVLGVVVFFFVVCGIISMIVYAAK